MDKSGDPPHYKPAVLASRIFTVLAAFLLVSAFALAVLPPDGMNLAQGLTQLGRDAPVRLHHVITTLFGAWLWLHVVVPVLVRPIWLPALSLGMLCAGIAASTLPPAESARRTGRRL